MTDDITPDYFENWDFTDVRPETSEKIAEEIRAEVLSAITGHLAYMNAEQYQRQAAADVLNVIRECFDAEFSEDGVVVWLTGEYSDPRDRIDIKFMEMLKNTDFTAAGRERVESALKQFFDALLDPDNYHFSERPLPDPPSEERIND